MRQPAVIAAMQDWGTAIDQELRTLLPDRGDSTQPLAKAMAYPVLSGGKRFRPYLVRLSGQVLGVGEKSCLRVGASVELLHTYSLVHDDLPAMDDARMRRGQPACHLAFDEATAILVGDALLALAFEAICRDDWPATSDQRAKLVRKLSYAAGGEQLCAGQMLDLQSPKVEQTIDDIRRLQALKTGAMIRYCCEACCVLADADTKQINAFSDYAAALGAAFQISDDLLDLFGDSAETGKDLGRDQKQAKSTFVTHLGEEGARAELVHLTQQADEAMSLFGDLGQGLRDLFDFVINRRN